ncbi:hypothetical protein [Pontibacter harenae]|uniref:hypothetical protein n=1 Tax=Pontibacter harenae TaxID=2894083 RepID=UPI001E4F80FD|nr:hypothetical protein [Pontibacter harenae]MCC9168197.1 hypothetical protein [Pontibacter harenae]
MLAIARNTSLTGTVKTRKQAILTINRDTHISASMPAIEPSTFFKQTRSVSEIKTELLSKCFEAWCATILPNQTHPIKTALYIDTFSSSGYDEAGTAAFPLRILKRLYASTGTRTDYNELVQPVFTDANLSDLSQLRQHIEGLPYYEELKHVPIVLENELDHDRLKELLHELFPTLIAMELFGSSFAQNLLLESFNNSNSSFFMLFDMNALKKAVTQKNIEPWIEQLFGDKLIRLKEFISKNRNAVKREDFILECFDSIFKNRGFQLATFKITSTDKSTPSFYVLYATRSEAEYFIVKETLTAYSEFQEDGVPLFGVNLAHYQTSLFQEHYTYSILNLVKELSEKVSSFNYKKIEKIYELHSIGTNYTKDNYKAAVSMLMSQGKVMILNEKTLQSTKNITLTSIVKFC